MAKRPRIKQTKIQKRIAKRDIRLLTVVTIIFVVLCLYGGVKNLKELKRENEHVAAYSQLVEEQMKEQQSLTEEFEALKRGYTNSEIIRLARDRFNLVFPNEIIMIPRKQ